MLFRSNREGNELAPELTQKPGHLVVLGWVKRCQRELKLKKEPAKLTVGDLSQSSLPHRVSKKASGFFVAFGACPIANKLGIFQESLVFASLELVSKRRRCSGGAHHGSCSLVLRRSCGGLLFIELQRASKRCD